MKSAEKLTEMKSKFDTARSTLSYHRSDPQIILSTEQIREILSHSSSKHVVKQIQSNQDKDLHRLMDNPKFTPEVSSEEEEASVASREHEYEEECTEEETDEEEENEDEDEDEDEEEDEDEDVEEESEESVLEDEYAMAQYDLLRRQLIDRYLTLYKDYKYMQKKNYFLQDKLYQVSVRKGIIVEEKPKEVKPKKKRRTLTLPHRSIGSEEQDDQQSVSSHRESENVPPSFTEITDGIRENHMTIKYESAVRRIWQMENLREDIIGGKDERLVELNFKKEEAEKECLNYFSEVMEQVRTCSKDAVNSNTGHHLNVAETENYVKEMRKLFHKLHYTINKFYTNWHSLNFELKRLEEAELESKGEGLQAIEYAQLCGENETLKDRLEYRVTELEKTKGKISHSTHILAHYKEKEEHVLIHISKCQAQLDVLKERIMKLSEIMEVVTQRFTLVHEEQKELEGMSQLVDNVTFMKDFRQTSQDVNDLTVECNKLRDQERTQSLRLVSLKDHINNLKFRLPELRQKAGISSNYSPSKASNSQQSEAPFKGHLLNEMKKLRLLELLESRHFEPWKVTREQLMTETRVPCFASHKVTTIPV